MLDARSLENNEINVTCSNYFSGCKWHLEYDIRKARASLLILSQVERQNSAISKSNNSKSTFDTTISEQFDRIMTLSKLPRHNICSLRISKSPRHNCPNTVKIKAKEAVYRNTI